MIRKTYVLRRSQSQEKAIAKDTGGRVMPGSGSMSDRKGDVSTDVFLVEAKMTDKTVYRLELGLFRKITKEAAMRSREPAMVVEMAGQSLAVISYDNFLWFQQLIRKEREK